LLLLYGWYPVVRWRVWCEKAWWLGWRCSRREAASARRSMLRAKPLGLLLLLWLPLR
jgi:hypothetical protein